jgi:hypothetical protein
VRHGSRTAAKGLARRPTDLLAETAPVSAGLLRPGGAPGIAWNTFVARREKAGGMLAAAGLEVLDDAPYDAFRHRLDQSIQRDILLARKRAAQRETGVTG